MSDSICAKWVLDATVYKDDGIFCFCPIEDDGTILTGLNYIGDLPPGNLVGIVHLDGDAAVHKWIDEHPKEIHQLMAALDLRNKEVITE